MPPKAQPKNQPKIVYPPGVKDITDDLGTDEIVRRLKACAQAFQSMGQDDNNQDFVPLAMHLAHDSLLEHSSKDVRLLIACCIADVFRVYAPEAPYKDPEHLKIIFLFLIQQLRGLEDPKDPAFKRYFYLLENLAWVKSFNICIELEENQEIFCQLFTLMFTIVNDDHSSKVKNFMLDMMCPLISEADTVSQELLDVILSNIIEPRKSQNKNAYNLAKDLLKRTAATIEPYIQGFFNNALILGKTSESDVATHLYELIYELNSISPSVLLSVLPQLEFKLKSNDEKERLDVTRLLARMFSDKNSELASQHQSLWNCFLGRFNDISYQVRQRCVQYSMHFLLNHPELKQDIAEQLKLRQHDPEETVRYEVVMAIVSAAKRDFSSISNDLLEFVKERTLDKKFKIRKEALLGLSLIYKRCMTMTDVPESTRECISWIKNKVLHVYYQTALEDRLLVERILHTCLVPYQSPTKERMIKLYQLYATVDDHAVKAFNELLKCQHVVRNHVRALLDHLKEENTEEREKQIVQKIIVLAKSLPEPVKAQEFIKKLMNVLQSDNRLRGHMDTILKPNCSCKEAEESVREVLKKLGNPVMTNVFYMTVKQMLERVAPVLIDNAAVTELLELVSEALDGRSSIEDGGPCLAERGLKLLYTLSLVFPGSFQYTTVYEELLKFFDLQNPHFKEFAAETTLQIFANIGCSIEMEEPDIAIVLVPRLKGFAQQGTVKQAKHAVRCLVSVCRNKALVFDHTLEELKKNLTFESKHFITALVAIGHIAYYCPDLFGAQMKIIVSKNVVKELLMQDLNNNPSDENWCLEEDISEETQAKMESMKLMVRWLLGLKNATNSANSTLKLLSTVIMHDGDLMERDKISRAEKAWLRLTAGCCILRLCQEQAYADIITPEQFVTTALLISDPCLQVRDRFAAKLHKGLVSLKLPLEFMAIFALGGNETDRELKNQFRHFLLANINKRRDYLKQHSISNGTEKMFLYLPDYVIPYAIHLLAHDPEFKKFDHVKSLQTIKECLWFLLEPLMTKNENYSFSFFKRLLENIKQTKDAQNPGDEVQNMKLYAVCDLALSLILSKTTSFVLVEFPVEPSLPKRLFTEIDRSYSNTKTYLPPELAVTPPKKSGIEMGAMFQPKPPTPQLLAGRRGRPRLTRDAESGKLRRPATNGNTDENNEEDETLLPPATKRTRMKDDDDNNMALREEEDDVESMEVEDEDPALLTRKLASVRAATVLLPPAAVVAPSTRATRSESAATPTLTLVESNDVAETVVVETEVAVEKESVEEKEKENDNQNNQRPRRSTRDSNRKDDDSQDRGGSGHDNVMRSNTNSSSRNQSTSSDRRESKSTKGNEKDSGGGGGGKETKGHDRPLQHKLQIVPEAEKTAARKLSSSKETQGRAVKDKSVTNKTTAKMQHPSAAVITRRGSTLTESPLPPRTRLGSSPTNHTTENSRKRLRSSSQDETNNPTKSILTKSARSEDQVLTKDKTQSSRTLQKSDTQKPLMQKSVPVVQKSNSDVLPTQKAESQKTVVQKLQPQKPAAQKLVSENPAVQKPVSHRPAAQKLHAQRPVTQKSDSQKAVIQKSDSQKAVIQRPHSQKPAVQKLDSQKLLVHKPTSPPRKPFTRNSQGSAEVPVKNRERIKSHNEPAKKNSPKDPVKVASPSHSVPLPQKDVASVRKNLRRAPPFANGMDKNLHSDGEESENSSPRKSTRIQAKTDVGPGDKTDVKKLKPSKRGRR